MRVEQTRKTTTREDFKDEFEVIVHCRSVGHRIRAMCLTARNADIDILASPKAQFRWLDELEYQAFDVMGKRFDCRHHSLHSLDRQAGEDHLLIIVKKFDRQVAVGVAAA